MFGGKNVVYGVVIVVLLVLVFFIVVFVWLLFFYEIVNKNSRKNFCYEQVKNFFSLGYGKEQKGLYLLWFLRYLVLIEYFLYLYFDLINFDFFGKVDIFFFCYEIFINIIFYVGIKMDYFDVVVVRVEGENILEMLVVMEIF